MHESKFSRMAPSQTAACLQPARLCAITRHRAWRTASRDARLQPTEPSELDRLLLAESAELGAHPAEDVARKLEREAVRAALARLPEEHRTPLQLRYYEEWSVEQI